MKKRNPKSEERQKSRVQVNLKLDRENDKDLIELLNGVDKKQTFIKRCIRMAGYARLEPFNAD